MEVSREESVGTRQKLRGWGRAVSDSPRPASQRVWMEAELRKSGDATHFATDGPAPRRYDGHTTAARVRVAVFVRSEYSIALVDDGVLQPAPRSANLDSAFGGMQLFATEAWRAAPLLLTHSAQLTQPTVRLPQL